MSYVDVRKCACMHEYSTVSERVSECESEEVGARASERASEWRVWRILKCRVGRFVAAMSGDCLGHGAPCRALALSGEKCVTELLVLCVITLDRCFGKANS